MWCIHCNFYKPLLTDFASFYFFCKKFTGVVFIRLAIFQKMAQIWFFGIIAVIVGIITTSFQLFIPQCHQNLDKIVNTFYNRYLMNRIWVFHGIFPSFKLQIQNIVYYFLSFCSKKFHNFLFILIFFRIFIIINKIAQSSYIILYVSAIKYFNIKLVFCNNSFCYSKSKFIKWNELAI